MFLSAWWIITGNDTHVNYYTPTSKQRSIIWCEPGEPTPKKGKMTRSTGKIRATIFRDWKDILLHKYHPASVNTAQDTYEQMLKALWAAILRKCREVHWKEERGHKNQYNLLCRKWVFEYFSFNNFFKKIIYKITGGKNFWCYKHFWGKGVQDDKNKYNLFFEKWEYQILFLNFFFNKLHTGWMKAEK